MLAKMELTHVLDICNFVAQSFQLKVPRLVHYLGKPRNRGLLTILVSTNAVRTGRTFDSSRNILQEPVNTDLIELRKQLLGMVRYGELWLIGEVETLLQTVDVIQRFFGKWEGLVFVFCQILTEFLLNSEFFEFQSELIVCYLVGVVFYWFWEQIFYFLVSGLSFSLYTKAVLEIVLASFLDSFCNNGVFWRTS